MNFLISLFYIIIFDNINNYTFKAEQINQSVINNSEYTKTLPFNINLEQDVTKTITNDKEINNFKHNLYSLDNKILEQVNNDIRYIDYSMEKEIMQRDEIPVDKVKDEYIKLIDDYKTEKTLTYNNKSLTYWEVKNKDIENKDIETIVIYFHWQWWNKEQWINDYTFWWNFNRIQNLMLLNNGIYTTVDFTDFYNAWVNDLEQLMERFKKDYPNANFILSWASSGWTLLWNIINKTKFLDDIKWIVLLGSVLWNYDNIINKNIPIFIWHWTNDTSIGYKNIYWFYDNIKKDNINYPIKIDFYNKWVHGTPIRMADWYYILDFIKNI